MALGEKELFGVEKKGCQKTAFSQTGGWLIGPSTPISLHLSLVIE